MPGKVQINFHVSLDERELIRAMAKADGGNVSAFLRGVVLAEAELRGLEPVPEKRRIKKRGTHTRE